MSVMAGVFFAAVTLLPTAAAAAADCRGNPAGVAPSGKHWYYQLNRTTGQNCWYLGMKRSSVRVAARKPVRTYSSASARSLRSPVPPSIANAQASIQDTVNQATARNEIALSRAGVAREVTYEELLKSTFGSRWADPIDMTRAAGSRSVASNAAGIRQPSPALASLHTRFSDAADYLVTEGRSSADILAVLLASAGGLLVLVGLLGRLQVARSPAPEYPDPLYYPQFDEPGERPLLTFAPRDLDEADEPDRYGIPAAPLQVREVDAAAEEAARPLFAPPNPGRFNEARKSQLLARTAAE